MERTQPDEEQAERSWRAALLAPPRRKAPAEQAATDQAATAAISGEAAPDLPHDEPARRRLPRSCGLPENVNERSQGRPSDRS